MYIHVIIVAPEKISAPADIPWRREWRHSANSTPLIKSAEIFIEVAVHKCKWLVTQINIKLYTINNTVYVYLSSLRLYNAIVILKPKFFIMNILKIIYIIQNIVHIINQLII